jgi:hypothetical protein
MILLVILTLVLVSTPPLLTYYSADYKINEDWKGFVHEIRFIPGSDDTIIVVSGFYLNSFIYYFNSPAPHAHEYAAFSTGDLEKIFAQKGENRVFFIVCYPEYVDPSGGVQKWITDHATLVTTHSGISLYRSV